MLHDRDRCQERLRALKQDPTRSFDQNSVSTESSSAQAASELDIEGKQQSSHRSSLRSEMSQRPPRSPQPGHLLDALQASLEAEIAKSSNEHDPITSSSTDVNKNISVSLAVDSSGERAESRPKRVPTPLDLSAHKSRTSEPLPRPTFLLPGSGNSETRNGRLSPSREPPPSAPPFRTFVPDTVTATTRQAQPLFSPGLPASPRPYTPSLQILSPMVGKIVSDDSEPRTQQRGSSSTPRTSKPPTPTETTEELTDSSLSPHTPSLTSPRDVFVETIHKSPLAPRRARLPSHRSNPSATHTSTSSIVTISEPTMSTSPIVGRVSRSLSVEIKHPDGRSLVPPEESLERRKSRSFSDLHSLANTFDELNESADHKSQFRDASLTGMGRDESINELQRDNRQSQISAIEEVRSETIIEPPRRAPPAPPTSQESSLTLQPAFTTRPRSSSNTSRLVTLAINPNDILSVVLSVLSVRSRKVPTATGQSEETLFTIRCRMKNPVDRSDSEILRVEKSFTSLMELGENLSSITGMAPFLSSFFDDFPVEKSGQRKVFPVLDWLTIGRRLLFRSSSWISIR